MTFWIHKEKKSGLRRYLRGIVVTTAAATSWVLMSATPTLAADCITKAEETAIQTRIVQTELMVAALTCNEATRYNAFVKTYRPQLMESHSSIAEYFKRTRTQGAESALNTFMTDLANEASFRSAQDKKKFCADASEIFGDTLKSGGITLSSYVRRVDAAKDHGMKNCQREAKAPTPKDKPGRSRFSLFRGKSD